jgi:hypothetical protein
MPPKQANAGYCKGGPVATGMAYSTSRSIGKMPVKTLKQIADEGAKRVINFIS